MPKVKPTISPIFLPNVSDDMTTGIIAVVATIGPIGILPSGVKQNIASIAIIKHTFKVILNFIT